MATAAVNTLPNGTLAQEANGFLTPEGIQSLINSFNSIVGTGGNTTQSGTVTQTGTNTTTGNTTQTGISTNVGTANNTTVGVNSGTSSQTSGQTGTGTTTSRQVSPEALAFLQQVAPGIIQAAGSGSYSREQAITDSKGTVDMIMRTLQEQTLPQLYSAEAGSGAYNSTTKALLGNDAAARAALAGSAAVAENISRYGAVQAANNNSLIGLVNAAAQANRESTGATTNEQIGTQAGTTGGRNEQTTTGTTTSDGVTTSNGVTGQTSTNTQTAVSNATGTNATQGLLQNPTAQKLAGAFGIFAALQKTGLPKEILRGIQQALGLGNYDFSRMDFSKFDGSELQDIDDFRRIFGDVGFSDVDPNAIGGPADIFEGFDFTDVNFGDIFGGL